MFEVDGMRVRIPVAHRAQVSAVASMARPGSPVVSAGADAMLRGWDATSGRPTGFAVATGDGKVKYVGLAMVRGLVLAVSVDSQAVRRFDLESERQIGGAVRPAGRELLTAAALLSTAESLTIVAAGNSGKIHLWDGLTGGPMGSGFSVPGGEALAMVPAHRAGVVVISTVGGHVRLWDVARGATVGLPFLGHQRPITALTCTSSPDGRPVVIGQEFRGAIHRWDGETGEPIGPPLSSGGRGPHRGGLAVAGDGTVLMSVDAGGTAWRWDLSRPDPVAEALSHEALRVNGVTVAVTTSGPVFVTGSENGQLRRWDMQGRLIGPDLLGHPAAMSNMVAVPASPHATLRSVLVSSSNTGALCWDPGSGANVGKPPFAPLQVGHCLAATWLPGGQLVVAGVGTEGLTRTEVFSGRCPEDSAGLDADGLPVDDTIWDVAPGVLPDGRPFFAAACASSSVQLLNAATGRPVRAPLQGMDQANCVAVAGFDDGTVMVAAGGDECQVWRWNAVTGEHVGRPLTTSDASVLNVAFRILPDGRTALIAIDADGWVHRWDALTGEPIGDRLKAPGDVGELALLASVAPGPVIVVGQGDAVRIWHAGTGELLADIADATCATTLTLPDGAPALAVGHRDGSLTVTALAGPCPQILDT